MRSTRGSRSALALRGRVRRRDAVPSAPPRPRDAPACPALTNERFCAQHRKERQWAEDRHRGSSTARGYGNRWRARHWPSWSGIRSAGPASGPGALPRDRGRSHPTAQGRSTTVLGPKQLAADLQVVPFDQDRTRGRPPGVGGLDPRNRLRRDRCASTAYVPALLRKLFSALLQEMAVFDRDNRDLEAMTRGQKAAFNEDRKGIAP